MKKEWLILFLLVIQLVSASTIADWPKFFVHSGKFTAKYVVGEEAPALDVVSATVISTSLAKFENVTTEIGTSTLDTEISNISIHDAVIIGSPCENKAAFQLMGNPDPCYKDLGGSVGYIKLYQGNGRTQLLITGLDEKDRSAAAKYLAQKDLSGIQSTEYVVPSNSGSVPSFFVQKAKNVTKNVTTNTTFESNVTYISPTPIPVIAQNVTPKKVVPGPYEPIEEMPVAKKKGWWAGFWDWLIGLFT
jgi:hypothetical protein